MSASGGKFRAPQAQAREGGGGSGGIPPPENFEKMGYLRPHFVRFEDSLLGNKPYKGEGSKDNNSGTFLNSKRSFRNRTLYLTNNDGSSFKGRLEKDRYLYFVVKW